MFYYPCVLERRTGCFATIWLAATKGIKIQRREFLQVNVKRTCDDIMDYVLVRVPPPQPGLPRPRFSLYLSAQLQYGTIIVYHRQCAMLLEEVQSTLSKLSKSRQSGRIDMEDPGRAALEQDALSAMEEYEWANDPFFGQMHSGILPSPSTLVQQDLEVMRRASPERPLLPSPGTPPVEGSTASSGSITLLERELPSLPSSQQFEGAELPEVTDAEQGMIELLMDQSDHFPDWETERPERERPERERPERESPEERPEERPERERPERERAERERPERAERESAEERPEERPERERAESRQERGIVTPADLQTPSVPPEDPSASGLPMDMPAALSRERTPTASPRPRAPPGPRIETPVHEEVRPVERTQTRRRRRQLLFMDEHTQISQDALREQLENNLIQTMSPVFFRRPSQMILPPVVLLNTPCCTLPPELLLLWKQAAVIHPLIGSDLLMGERGTDSDSERERERAENREEEGGEREEEKEEEISPKEVVRELAESGLSQPDVSAPSLLALEVSDREPLPQDIPVQGTPDSQGSSVSRRSLPRLMDIPEEALGPPGQEELEWPLAPGSGAESEEDVEVPFHSLLPPQARRRTVAHYFFSLLENVAARRLCVQQDEPYREITITPGPAFTEEILDV